jgi:hypothetical protein
VVFKGHWISNALCEFIAKSLGDKQLPFVLADSSLLPTEVEFRNGSGKIKAPPVQAQGANSFSLNRILCRKKASGPARFQVFRPKFGEVPESVYFCLAFACRIFRWEHKVW